MIFGKTVQEWEKTGAHKTAVEISQQPATWRKTVEIVRNCKDELDAFIKQVTANEDFDIVFTGAGTSEYVGNAAYHALTQKYGFHMHPLGSTDLVVAPWKYLNETKPTLLVHFARSGKSKESMGSVQAAEAICKNVYHLVITCNRDGLLAQETQKMPNAFIVQLPDETNDQGMAMTSSFSNMYLAILLALQLDKFDEVVEEVLKICDVTEKVLAEDYKIVEKLVDEYDYNRLICLGSGELKEIGHEAMLKTLELTKGYVFPMYESPVAFRHGPTFILDDRTLVLLHMSDDPYTRMYEKDLLEDLYTRKEGDRYFVLINTPDEDVKQWADASVSYDCGCPISNAVLGLGYIVTGQMFSFFKSQKLEINTDRPAILGARANKVKGMTIYPYEG